MRKRLNAISLTFIAGALLVQAGELRDGFYVEDPDRKSNLRIDIKDPSGKTHQVRIKEYVITVRDVVFYALGSEEKVFQVQIGVTATNDAWTKEPIFVVVNNKPYVVRAELFRSSESARQGDGTGYGYLPGR